MEADFFTGASCVFLEGAAGGTSGVFFTAVCKYFFSDTVGFSLEETTFFFWESEADFISCFFSLHYFLLRNCLFMMDCYIVVRFFCPAEKHLSPFFFPGRIRTEKKQKNNKDSSHI